MSHDVINFLPEDKIQAFKRMYGARVLSAVALALVFVVAAHVALLAPAYVYIHETYTSAQMQLAALQNTDQKGDSNDMVDRVAAAHKNANTLKAFLDTPQSSTFIQALLGLPSDGISLGEISVDIAETSGRALTMRVSGVASTREALRTYHLAVSGLPFVAQADMPLSVYARESDIPFSIAITGTTTP